VGFGYSSICKALARCGIDDITGIIVAFQDETRHDETRGVIMDALVKLQKHRPTYHPIIIQTLIAELSKLAISRRRFYSLIVAALVNLEARESLPLIEKAYKQQLIEPDCCCGLSDIQKRLEGEVVPDPAIDQFETDMEEITSILCNFEEACHPFPKDAVLQARKYRDLIIPSLIESIRQATAYARYDVPIRDTVNLFAIHLLAEFQAKEALPFIFESLSLTDDQTWNLYDDSFGEAIPSILYRLISDDVEFYTGKILDSATPDVLRGILVDVLPFLVKSKTLERESYAAILRKCFRAVIDEKKEMLSIGVIDLLLECGDDSDIPLIEEAFSKGLVDKEFVGLNEAIEAIRQNGKELEKDIQRRTEYDCSDTVNAMSGWACFKPKPQTPLSSPPRLPPASPDDLLLGRPPKIGRNDPCPCGSGKKYKKCCLEN
jgi:hypothetical protein